jgi:hypothetical protein
MEPVVSPLKSQASYSPLDTSIYERVFVEESRKNGSLIYGAIRALSSLVEGSKSKTCQGLIKDLEPACARLEAVAKEDPEIITGKTVLTLKAVCAIY